MGGLRRMAVRRLAVLPLAVRQLAMPRFAAWRKAAWRLAVAALLAVWTLAPAIRPAPVSADAKPLITAHRGSSHRAPENTLAAIRQAMADGADIVEIDVQMTLDGVVILFHDKTLDKIGLSGRVADVPYSVIAAADAGSWHSIAHAGERVPTLEQALAETMGRIRLNIELKMTDPSLPLPEAVAAMLDGYGMTESAIVTSFDREALRRARAVNPGIRTGLIVGSKNALREDIWKEQVDILSVRSGLINRGFVDKARRTGKEVHVWTVNSRKETRRLAGLGVTSIITDRPDALRTWLN